MTAAPETRYAVTQDGVDIAYVVLGDGPVDLVWIPAHVSHVELYWEGPFAHRAGRFLEGLARFARVATFDKRGTGASSRLPSGASPEVWLDDLRAVLDAVGMERPAIWGDGFAGCCLGVLHAAMHPARTGSLILWAPGARTAWSDDHPWGITEQEFERHQAEVKGGWGSEAFVIEERGKTWGTMVSDPLLVPHIARYERLAATPGDAALFDRIWHQIDVREVLPAVNVPTLILVREGWSRWEGDDVRFMAEEARYRYVADRIKGSRMSTMHGSDFPPWIGDTDEVLAEAQEFLTGVRPAREPDRVLATVVFTDIVGSTEKQASLGDRGWKELVEQYHAAVRSALTQWRGVENDTAGDGFYVTFDGPARAINCAMEITERVRDLGLEVRVGVHTGECEVIDGKCGGLTVSIGARVAAKASPSEVLVSRTVKDLVAGSGLTFEDAGEHELRGVPDRWHLYRVVNARR